MNQKVLRVLEYDKIIKMLTEFANSAPGKEVCSNLTPMTQLNAIREAGEQTNDALSLILRKSKVSFSGNHNIKQYLKILEIGSILSPGELLKIASLLECSNRVKSYGRNDKSEDEPTGSLSEFFHLLEPLTPVSSEIRRCLLSEEEIADDASSTLRHIRRSMSVTNDKIHSQLANMINGSSRTYLQDAVITMRNNRYCVPVKSEYKGQVAGMVHDQSSSGSTFFIEPASIVALNNELKELQLREAEEIQVILANLSIQVSEYSFQIAQNQDTLTHLDFVFAKAALALEQNATLPEFNMKKQINIRKGRHPLLNKKTAVPIDVNLGKEFDLLIITGPNTGGKTVSLKTVGLFTLMGQSGLLIPALDHSQLSVFTEVYADIGDEQSIEQSLSTFSSHMTNTVEILKNADENSLCLFDELGAGTDPTEGAALAIAILTHLHKRNIRTMATTHYSELKVFALQTPQVENACCEFNVETLSPTYRLLIGVPGKSNAFAISSKLGLPANIIETAKEQISQENESFEDLLTDLEQSRIAMENEHSEAASYKERIKSLEAALQKKKEKLEDSKERILREANEKARDILQEAKEIADETIRDFQKSTTHTSVKDLEKHRQKLRSKIDERNQQLSFKTPPPAKGQLKPSQLHLGDYVKVLSMGLKGTVSSLPDQKGNLFVQCGIIRSQVHIDDLISAEETVTTLTYGRSSGGKMNLSKSLQISTEINLLGKTVDEAIAALDKYLDDAYLAHLPNVRIVHGKGTGALRNAVQKHLKKCTNVKSYRLGEFGEGDAGVTIATF